ncbi:hypothetical protein GWI33_002667 [Rhynchophorus ferrugineus]|uniref:Uncharacterized protein n=1 Tax=Rhynchophorus ferrugineus TaxID=354439 RepID=A0A834IK71_RHYFE|nr:hypothetical protein GWI33_002667 [Rhynchophorus ferrugineus]
MGGKHSSHKRLKSTPSKSYECTEVIDLEISDSVEPDPNPVKTNEATSTEITSPPENIESSEPIYPSQLLIIITHLDELEKKLNEMSDNDLFVHFPTIKDDLHNCWQNVYDIKEENLDTKRKKIELIETIKFLLKKANQRILKRPCN